jgi:PiT family inorganic phosphate transporter
MYVIRIATRKSEVGDTLFKEPKKNQPPPWWIRGILFITCTLVSFFHGSNDGQKGVGLAMLVLIGIVPTYFALNDHYNTSKIPAATTRIEQIINSIDTTSLSAKQKDKLHQVKSKNTHLRSTFGSLPSSTLVPKAEKFEIRKDVMVLDRNLRSLMKEEDVRLSETDILSIDKNLKEVRNLTDYSPTWVLFMISLSLGIGTMIGWKRIVKTIGEKIGKEHLTYAQGASAEMVAALTIGLSSNFGWPVSTTHVLSSGIAGSMVANKGVKNLNPDTIRNILIAWFLTLPVVMIMAGTLFLIFRAIF